jgi:hypothetical protein
MRWRKLVVTATLACISAAACATTSISGFYCVSPSPSPDHPRCELLIETPEGVWVADGEGARLADRDKLALRAPARAKDPWQVDMGELFSRTTDPVFDLMIGQLQGHHIFYSLGPTGGLYPRSMLVIDDALFIHTDRLYGAFPPECLAGILAHTPPGLRPPLDRRAQPRFRRRGFIERWIDVLALDHTLDDCPKTLDPAGYNSVRGLIAVAKVYLRDGRIKVVELEDKRFGRITNSSFYFPDDLSPSQIHAVSEALDLFPPLIQHGFGGNLK